MGGVSFFYMYAVRHIIIVIIIIIIIIYLSLNKYKQLHGHWYV